MTGTQSRGLSTKRKRLITWVIQYTFSISNDNNRLSLCDFWQHLNNQQPSICFTMETEKDNKLAFLDTAVLREPDGRLTTSVYRKPTHTDQYLAYDSHHPQSVKRGIVKCLYERYVTSRNKILCHLWGEKTSVICFGFWWLFFFFLAETYQDRKTKQQCRTRQRV